MIISKMLRLIIIIVEGDKMYVLLRTYSYSYYWAKIGVRGKVWGRFRLPEQESETYSLKILF